MGRRTTTEHRPGATFTIDRYGHLVPTADPPLDIRDHVVILNVNAKLPGIVSELKSGARENPLDIVVIVQDWAAWEDNPTWHPDGEYSGELYIRASGKSGEQDLQFAHVTTSRAAVVLSDPGRGELSDAHSTLAAVTIENMSPEVHTVVELISSINRVHLRSTMVNEVVCVGELTEKLISQSCISPGVKDVFEHLMSASASTAQIFTIPLPPSLLGKTYREIARQAIVDDAPFVMCGFTLPGKDPSEPGEIVLNPTAGVDPGKDATLSEGDMAIVIAASREAALDFWGWTCRGSRPEWTPVDPSGSQ